LVISSISIGYCLDFSDVNLTNVYYTDINYLRDSGIVSGVGNNKYSPSEEINLSDFLRLLFKVNDIETDDPLEKAVKLDLISPENLFYTNCKLTREAAFNIVYKFYIGTEYNTSLYVNPQSLSDVSYSNGICKFKGMSDDELLKRDEAAYIIHQLLVIDTSELTFPDYDIYDVININNTMNKNIDDICLSASKLPESLLTYFNKRGWILEINQSELDKYSINHNMNVDGLTNYAKKKIYLATENPVYHEFAHYLHMILGWNDKIDELYELENESLVKVLGTYQQTNSKEFFAVYFSYYFRHKNNEYLMKVLEEYGPETYKYFTELEETNWGLPDMMVIQGK
jgi:hypothetical protein